MRLRNVQLACDTQQRAVDEDASDHVGLPLATSAGDQPGDVVDHALSVTRAAFIGKVNWEA